MQVIRFGESHTAIGYVSTTENVTCLGKGLEHDLAEVKTLRMLS